jgi:hypothetical protein
VTESAPADETGATPTAIPASPSGVAGEGGRATRFAPGGSVQVAYMHSSRVSHSWHLSMMNMIAYDKSVGLNVIENAPFAVSCSGPLSLVEGRNLAASHFLDKTDAEWLFFVDTDMGFSADALEQLYIQADPLERPVVGGLCFAMKHVANDNKGGFRVMPVPTLFMWAQNDKQGVGFANRFIYPPEAMVQVAGTGAAFILIHRVVLDAIRAKRGDSWFNLIQYSDGTTISEDLSFCYRVGEIEAPIFVHTGVKVTHHKELWLGEGDYVMPPNEPMQHQMDALNHEGSDRWTGGDRKDEQQ